MFNVVKDPGSPHLSILSLSTLSLVSSQGLEMAAIVPGITWRHGKSSQKSGTILTLNFFLKSGEVIPKDPFKDLFSYFIGQN